MGFEPMTSSLPRKCSTPELRRLVFRSSVHLFISNLRIVRDGFLLPMNYWTNQPMNQPERKTRFELATYSLEGYRSTNWATSAFFNEWLSELVIDYLMFNIKIPITQSLNNSTTQYLWGEKDSNLRSRSNGFTVRPIWPLWYPPVCYSGPTMLKVEAKHRNPKKQSLLSGSNQWPTDYKSVALPAELRRLKNSPFYLSFAPLLAIEFLTVNYYLSFILKNHPLCWNPRCVPL